MSTGANVSGCAPPVVGEQPCLGLEQLAERRDVDMAGVRPSRMGEEWCARCRPVNRTTGEAE